MVEKYTLSIIKADVGGDVGHSSVHPELLAKADEQLAKAKKDGLIVDYCRGLVGDDTALIMSHEHGVDAPNIHEFAWKTFEAMTEVAQKLKQYGAGQDLLSTAFSGNVRGMGPGVAEMDIEERKAEPLLCFLADKTEPGAWNMPLYKMFCDPFTTAGLVIDPSMHDGFNFEVHDLIEKRKIIFSCPEEAYSMLAFIGAPGRYVIKSVFRKEDGMIAASTSTQRLSLIAGKYVGKDDPVMMVRCQNGLPAVGEALDPFAHAYMVAGWMRGSHHGPMMPVGFEDSTPTRFDGPPRVVCYGFQMANGNFIGPRDMFADVSYDNARAEALWAADYFRKQGPFEPHRLSLEDLEYTTMPKLMEDLKSKWQPEKDE
ncbi:MAG: fructose 1,6-bisphosphatase [Actinobacteria bacterium]|nr:MAG: fructose 1,6-bisphosphatase [Actinomycetota bacterium]